MILPGSISWTLVTLLTEEAYNWKRFSAPFFILYLATSWLIAFYPLHLLVQLCKQRAAFSLRNQWRYACIKYRTNREHFGNMVYKGGGGGGGGMKTLPIWSGPETFLGRRSLHFLLLGRLLLAYNIGQITYNNNQNHNQHHNQNLNQRPNLQKV